MEKYGENLYANHARYVRPDVLCNGVEVMNRKFSDTFEKACQAIQPYGIPFPEPTAKEFALIAEHYINMLEEDLANHLAEEIQPFHKGMLVIYESPTCDAVLLRITKEPERYRGVGEWFAEVLHPYAPEPQLMACKFMTRISYTNSSHNDGPKRQVRVFDGGKK
jgi:hypothetical protein